MGEAWHFVLLYGDSECCSIKVLLFWGAVRLRRRFTDVDVSSTDERKWCCRLVGNTTGAAPVKEIGMLGVYLFV